MAFWIFHMNTFYFLSHTCSLNLLGGQLSPWQPCPWCLQCNVGPHRQYLQGEPKSLVGIPHHRGLLGELLPLGLDWLQNVSATFLMTSKHLIWLALWCISSQHDLLRLYLHRGGRWAKYDLAFGLFWYSKKVKFPIRK